jgi:hypothetical protein
MAATQIPVLVLHLSALAATHCATRLSKSMPRSSHVVRLAVRRMAAQIMSLGGQEVRQLAPTRYASCSFHLCGCHAVRHVSSQKAATLYET